MTNRFMSILLMSALPPLNLPKLRLSRRTASAALASFELSKSGRPQAPRSRILPPAFPQIRQRLAYPVLCVWNLARSKAHLDTAQCPAQRQVVEKTQMPDAKHSAGELAESHAQRHVVALEDRAAQQVGVVTLGHHHRGDSGAVLDRIATKDL